MALVSRSPPFVKNMASFDRNASSIAVNSSSSSANKSTNSPTSKHYWGGSTFFYDSPGSPAKSGMNFLDSARSSLANSDQFLPRSPRSPRDSTLEVLSPVESNATAATDTTDIQDEPLEHSIESNGTADRQNSGLRSPLSPDSALSRIDTSVDATSPQGEPESGTTVIAAPNDFHKTFETPSPITSKEGSNTQSPSTKSENTIISPSSPEPQFQPFDRRESFASPIRTDVPPVVERPTPIPQTRAELEDEWQRRRLAGISLEGIPESQDSDYHDEEENDTSTLDEEHEASIRAMKDALSEFWALCTRLASLSSAHRARLFTYGGRPDVSEIAWRSCWKLCQNLYNTRESDPTEHVIPTLELCREFCQALFEARRKDNLAADSVLRVSFELNNHLYNTHDRNLPAAFSERTLDFYVTLCHRLVRQPNVLPQETDSLLKACWELAEILFNIRQGNRDRDGRNVDEDLLPSAIDACWNLSDLFKEGWARQRPERSTPRPGQGPFSVGRGSASPPMVRPGSGRSLARQDSSRAFPPETPTTIFDDIADPLDAMQDDHVPDIYILGRPPASPAPVTKPRHGRWPSSASSSISSYSSVSQTTGTSTAGPTHPHVNPTRAAVERHLDSIRVMLVTAATNSGFVIPTRSNSPPHARSPATRSREQTAALVAFVRMMPRDAFGQQSWQQSLLAEYRSIMLAWPLPLAGTLNEGMDETQRRAAQALIPPAGPTRASANDIAEAVLWMSRAERWRWLSDLFRITFGSHVEESRGRQEIIATA